ncbi:MAG TPA: FHA domain-containing protein [Azonexus sp.]|nr:FHA domain-containing protein [Azonexus sp.]
MTAALSVLSVDIIGGERLSASLDQAEALYALGRCEKRVRYALDRHGGSVVRHAGSNLTAFFTDGGEALQSAIDMQQRIAELPHFAGLPLTVKIGICSGHQVGEARFFSGDGPSPASSLSAHADPAHILLSLPRRLNLLPQLPLVADISLALPLNCGNRRLDICQIAWQDSYPQAMRTALSALGQGADHLNLQHRGRARRVDAKRPSLNLGRQAGADITLLDQRCSRVHGTIERCFDRFFFVDRSANGSYVVQDDQSEVFVHHKAHALLGRGRLYLGAPSSAEGVESIQFQTI